MLRTLAYLPMASLPQKIISLNQSWYCRGDGPLNVTFWAHSYLAFSCGDGKYKKAMKEVHNGSFPSITQ